MFAVKAKSTGLITNAETNVHLYLIKTNFINYLCNYLFIFVS